MIIKDDKYAASLYALARRHLESSITLLDQAIESDGQQAYDTLKIALTKLSQARRLLYSERNVLEDQIRAPWLGKG